MTPHSSSSDGVKLRSIAAIEHFDARKLWGDDLLLLVKAHSVSDDAALFTTPRGPTRVDTDESPILAITTALMDDAASQSYITPGSSVVPLRKTTRNPFDNAVIVGRARNNDIRLNHPTVSKVHAYLAPSKTEKDTWKVQDANSTNGTVVELGSGPVRLEPGQALRVTSGVELRFGSVACLLLDADALDAAIAYAVAAWRLDRTGDDTDTIKL